MSAQLDLEALLRQRGLLAILRGTDSAALLACIEVLAEEGVQLMEVSLRSTDALSIVRHARGHLDGQVVIGVGTVCSFADAGSAVEAGAQFLVTPALFPDFRAANGLGLPVLAGALSPTEVLAAMESGAAAVKLFPASLGGSRYLRALRDPFPTVPLVPVGGVSAESVPGYLDSGAIAVGVGSPLLGDAPSGGDLIDLRTRARQFLSLSNPAKRS